MNRLLNGLIVFTAIYLLTVAGLCIALSLLPSRGLGPDPASTAVETLSQGCPQAAPVSTHAMTHTSCGLAASVDVTFILSALGEPF